MRILAVSTHASVVGGIETYLQWALPTLAARGHELAFLHEDTSSTRERIEGPFPKWCVQELGFEAALSAARAWNADVIFVHSAMDLDVEEAVLQFNKPSLRFIHAYEGMCVSGSRAFQQPERVPCDREFGVGCLAAYYPRRCGGRHPGTLLRLYGRSKRQRGIIARHDGILVGSRHMLEEASRHFPTRHVRIAPFAVGSPPPALLQLQPRAPGRSLLFLGRLTALKGVDFLLRAVAQLERRGKGPLSVTIAGDGVERPALETLARTLDIDVRFLGWLSEDKRNAALREADLLAVPSVWPEPFGLVGIEAGALGVPAVAFDIAGVRDWLVPGISGELAPGDPPTPTGLADAIDRALGREHNLALRRGALAVGRSFTVDAHIHILEDELKRAIARRSTPTLTSQGGKETRPPEESAPENLSWAAARAPAIGGA